MRYSIACLAVSLVFLPGASVGDDCRDLRKGNLLGQLKSVLYVVDVKRSALFYRDTLGFDLLSETLEEKALYYAEMAAGETKFGLHTPGTDRERERVGKQRLYFRVADINTHRNYVDSCGGNPGEIVETAWMTMFSVTDPDGHEITFAETDLTKHTIDPW
jgi:catechol 2,3-dioxygenase-like lactoylglutathione lyase family enzyme